MKLFFDKLFKLFFLASCLSIVFLSCNKSDTPNPEDKNSGCDCDKKYGSFTDKRDKHVYKTIKIGAQTWMAENLAYLPAINSPEEGSYTKPFYYVQGYEGRDSVSLARAKVLDNYFDYGVLYNWIAAIKVCPSGWHLPKDAEWEIMENFLIDKGYGYGGRGEDIAKSLASCDFWECPDNDCQEEAVGFEPERNDSSCFSALPGGYFFYAEGGNLQGFYALGTHCYWWSSVEKDKTGAYAWWFSSYRSDLERGESEKGEGFSVRCIKD